MIYRAPFSGSCHSCDKPVKAGEFISYTEGNDYTEHVHCSEEGKRRAESAIRSLPASFAADVKDFNPPAPAGMSFYPFQKAGIHYALTRPKGIGTLFGDEMGLGKSPSSLGVLNCYPNIRKVLIVCPASLKHNWKYESGQWLTAASDIQIHSGQPLFDSEKQLHVQITNFDRLGELPANVSWDALIIDEVHYIKGRVTQRTKNVKYLSEHSKLILALTGTPIPNSPEDLWPILQILDPARWSKFSEFSERYCNAHATVRRRGKALVKYMDTSGASNLDELQEYLRGTIMVRRLKKDVLTELPDKIRKILVLPPDGFEKLIADELAIFAKYGFTDEISVEQLKLLKVPFEEISAARKKTGLAKVPLVIEHVKACLSESNNKKIILFAHHSEVLSKLFDALGEYGPAIIRGETPDHMRQSAVERFQGNPYCRLFIGSIGAASVGLTLTASSHVVFAEQSWSPKDMSQAEDRAHRIGQKESVLVELLVFDNSLDANMMKKLKKKMEVANAALDR